MVRRRWRRSSIFRDSPCPAGSRREGPDSTDLPVGLAAQIGRASPARETLLTWQYDIHWAATQLRKRGTLRAAALSGSGRWELAPRNRGNLAPRESDLSAATTPVAAREIVEAGSVGVCLWGEHSRRWFRQERVGLGAPAGGPVLASLSATVGRDCETMDPSQQKEQFSRAYVHAVATVAGYGTAVPVPDDDSIDVMIFATGTHSTPRRPRLEVQVKCTGQDIVGADELRFSLKIKNYNDLRATRDQLLVPRILVVMIVPQNVGEWVRQTEEELVLRHCAYWRSLHGSPDTENEDAVTVAIPRRQVFTPTALQEIMQRVNDGGLP